MDIKKFIKVKKIILLSLLAVLVLFPLVSFAQAPIDIQGILDRLNEIMDIIGFGVISITMSWIGIMYLLARGDPGKIQTANKALMWAMIGIAVFSIAYISFSLIYYIVRG